MDNTCDACNKEGQKRFICRENDCIYSIKTKPIEPVLVTASITGSTPVTTLFKKVKTVVLPKIKTKKRFKLLPVLHKVVSNPLFKALAMRTLVGRIAYAIVGSATLGALTTNNIIMFDDLSYIQIGITLAAFGLGFIITKYVKNSSLATKLDQLVEVLSNEFVKATDKASEGGEKVTQSEAKSIITSVLNSIFK